MFMSDRGSNIIKALEGHDLLFCFAHRINNVLQRSFYQIITKTKKEKTGNTTPCSTKRRLPVQDSSDESADSDNDEICTRPSPSKHPQAVIVFSEVPSKPKELLEMITAAKSLVKYVKMNGLNREIQQNNGVALQQSNITRWLSLSSLLQSVEASIEHIRSILSTRSTTEKQNVNINKININGLKDIVILLQTFQDVIKLIQTGDRPSLHMVYVCLNKLQLHLNGKDIDPNGDLIIINDRHEGTEFFRQRKKQLLSVMFHLDKKHLAAAFLHPQYRKLTFVDEYTRSKTHIYVNQVLKQLYGYGIN
ncbi:unnamed protein product [Adineta steineri]|uniref:Uncharacterized protein n=1 Tax=Adineta steineri TaxID=433720 RepID=A0A815MPM8_9BILA|nr:unnamed protein product [Adineta steineri]CAF3863960.1 unnamed protein product [Adineta steineri]